MPFSSRRSGRSPLARSDASRACLRLVFVAAGAVLPAMLAPSLAQAADPPKATTESSAEAEKHFAHARELYQQGAYREAIGELETALTLDPNGKGLVFNLGVVHEKLGDIEDALKYFQRYEQMDLDPQERAKADAYVKRLQGARHEVEKPVEPPPPPQQAPPAPPPPPQHGRIDGWTVGALTVAVAGYTVGTIFGLRALSERPKAGFVTGTNGTYSDLQNEADKAHRAAIVSDVAFAAGIVATGVTAYLYFGRTKPASDGGKTGDRGAPVVVYGSAVPGGGALFLGGRF